MLTLVDGDILVYRVGFAAQKKQPDGELEVLPERLACARMRDTYDGILAANPAKESRLYITSSDKSNFRNALYPLYKANRKAPKPLLYDVLRKYMVKSLKAIEVFGQEADDALGIEATKVPDSVICSIDKDLDQIPGKHYNFVKAIHYQVTPEEGLRFFYKQLLQGDLTDNIPGIPGIGPVKAEAALAKAVSERHLYMAARAMYQKHFLFDWEHHMRLNGRLLKIRQYEGELWDLPVLDETDEPGASESVPA
jgi:DNA polymerase-1